LLPSMGGVFGPVLMGGLIVFDLSIIIEVSLLINKLRSGYRLVLAFRER